MKIPLPKLKAVLLYLANNTDVKFLGKVKLMKLFYFLDFMHLKQYGGPITYDTYINLDHGPIPSFIKNLIDDAADDINNSILADTIQFERPKGTIMYQIHPKREFTDNDKKYFSETELEVLKKVCQKFGDKNTKYIEDASHSEAPWKKTKFLDRIPYTLAAEDIDSKTTKEEIALLMEIS